MLQPKQSWRSCKTQPWKRLKPTSAGMIEHSAALIEQSEIYITDI